MSATDVAEWISLFLTIPTLFLSAAVVLMYRPDASKALKAISSGRVPWRVHMLILGIVIGFAGSFFDNLYWGIAWGAEALGHPARDWWFSNGVWSNLPFRQGTGVLAGLCHVIAATRAKE